jgi:type I restriction enzyme S subunit
MSEYNNELIESPKYWEVKKLKDIIIYKKGIKPKELHIKKVNDNYLPYLTAEYLRGESKPKYVNPNENKIIVAEPEDILMIWDGSGAGDLFIGFKGIVASTFVCIKCNKNIIYPKYLYYYLLKKAETLKQRTKGTGIPHINKETFENLLIPIPPLEEQKKIAEILNNVDSIISDTTNLIEKLKLLKEKSLNLLITGKIWHKEFKDTEIGEFPKEWEVKRLKDVIIKAKSGGTPRTNVPEYWNGNISFAKAQDITKSSKYLHNTEEFITEKGLENSNAWIVPKDSLLLTIYGSTLGFLAINKIPVATNQQIIGIIPNKNIIDIEFLYYWYLYFKPYWSRFIRKDAIPHLTHEIVLNNLIPIPPLEEQKKIVEILSTIDNKIETETKYLDYMKKLKEKLLAALMTGKIRVNSIAIGDLK